MKQFKTNVSLLAKSCALAAGMMPALLANAADTSAALNAAQLLQHMNTAFSRLSYDGVFSYLSGNELTSLRVVHKIVDGVQRERLVHLNGAPREIIRQGERVSCIVLPGDDLLALEKSIPAGPFARAFIPDFDRIADTYSVGRFGEGRVAGRMATRVAVSPRDQHRYGYRLWLDNDTSLLLRSELVDHEGNKLEIFMFNHVLLGDEVADEALEPSDISGSMASHLTLAPTGGQWRAEQAAQSNGAWATGWLPSGFKMAGSDLRSKPGSGEQVNSLMYSDGLAAFSIYIEPMPDRGAASMISQNGATVAVTHTVGDTVDGTTQHFLVTLVGEIPVSTAQEIVASVQRR
jgi:sigma-E factor negative regulatory protein RseB